MSWLLLAALAQTPPDDRWEVDLNVTHAFNRRLASGWQPYLVTVSNNGPRDLDLTLVARQPGANLKVTRRVPLASGARQQFFFYTYSRYWDFEGIDVELVDAAGARVAAPLHVGEEGTRTGYEQVSVLVLSKDSSTSSLGIPHEIAGSARWRTSPLDRFVCPPERVPDRAAALRPIGAIVLHDYPLDRLNSEQRQALVDYVVGGGMIVVVPGLDAAWLEDPFLRQLAPIRVSGSHEVRRLGGAAGALDLDPALRLLDFEGAEPVAPAGPLMVRYRTGAGTVLVAATDLNRRPLRGWDSLERLWTSILPARVESGSALPFQGSSRNHAMLTWTASNLRRTPPALLIGSLLLAYALAIGPLHLIFVRRVKRPLWAIGTIPAVAFGFVAVTVLAGWIFRGTASRSQQLDVLTSFSGDGVAHERVLLAVHASAGRTFDIESPEGMPLEPTNMENESADMEAYGVWLEDRRPRSVIRDHAIGQFQTRFFSGERALAVGRGITAALAGDSLTVFNGSPMEIEAAVLIRGGPTPTATPLGALAAGDERTVAAALGGFDPVAALGRGPGDPVGRLLTGFMEEHRVNLQNLPTMLFCVVRRDPEPVGVDVGTRETATIWIVYLEEPAP